MKKIYLALFLVLFLATAAFAKLDLNKATVDELTALSAIPEGVSNDAIR